MRYNDFETMSIYTVENFTSDITVEGYIAEFRDEPHFLELCKQCTNYGKSWGCPPFDFDTESFLRQYKYAHLMATKIIPEDKDIPIEYTQKLILPERIRIESELLDMERKYGGDRKSTRLNSSHNVASRMPSSA